VHFQLKGPGKTASTQHWTERKTRMPVMPTRPIGTRYHAGANAAVPFRIWIERREGNKAGKKRAAITGDPWFSCPSWDYLPRSSRRFAGGPISDRTFAPADLCDAEQLPLGI